MTEIKLSRSEIIKFIRMYKEYDYLWNYKSPYYKRLDLKNKAWSAIANQFNTTVEQVKRKAKSLRSSYLSEKKKVERSKRSFELLDQMGHLEQMHEPSLFYFDEFRFIDNSIVLRKVNNDDVITSHVQASQDSHSQPESSIDYAEVKTNHSPEMESAPDVSENQIITNFEEVAENGSEEFVNKSRNKESIVDNSKDECEIFGQFIASELRSLNSNVARKRLKRKILRVIVEDEEDGDPFTGIHGSSY